MHTIEGKQENYRLPVAKIHKYSLVVLFITYLLMSPLTTLAQQPSATSQPTVSAGVILGSTGVGLSASLKSRLSFIANDQVQWRIAISGFNTEDLDDNEINYGSIDYIDNDISIFSAQGGMDWYPFHGRLASVFISSGLILSGRELEGNADTNKQFFVGGTQVNPGDIKSLSMKVEQSSVMPYISLGWGNKLSGKRGFSFYAEVGVSIPTNDADIELLADDPDNILSDADLSAEKDNIDDDISGARGFAMTGIIYHF